MGKRGQDDNDDEALWEKVVETAAPLKRGRNAAAPKPASTNCARTSAPTS